jgi:hypothetical protein
MQKAANCSRYVVFMLDVRKMGIVGLRKVA